MGKKKQESFADQVVSKLVEKTYEPLSLLMGGRNPVKDALEKHLTEGKNKIANGEQPNNFTIQGNGKLDSTFVYKYEMAIAYENNNPAVKSISLEVDGKKHTEQLESLKELPSIRYMKEKALTVDRKQVTNPRTVADDDGKGLKL
jgi:hypothetical protein